MFLIQLRMINLIKKWLAPLKHENVENSSDYISVIWVHGANQSVPTHGSKATQEGVTDPGQCRAGLGSETDQGD